METIISCLTPPGRAAIATLGVRGPRAWKMVQQLFRPAKGALPDEPPSGRFWFGRLGSDMVDEVVLAARDGNVEIHCHGGPEVVRMIQEMFVGLGAATASWEEFLQDDTLPLLARAPTTRTASILLDQASGAWKSLMSQTPDRERLRRLEELIPLGRHLVEPWKVVIAGPVNVGKSSLMNALAGYTRSVVSSIPGTTRDVVTTRLAIDGWPVEMTDTAGLRESPDSLEHQGIQRARAAIETADLRLWVLDGSAEKIEPDQAVEWCYLINKVDLEPAWDWDALPAALRVSAHTGAGVPELCEMISRRLVPHPPDPGEAVPCLPEQVEWVRRRP
jgi:tRNA modification GTPase